MKFYAACLASYNSGVLHGAWIDATNDPEEMQEAINEMLQESEEDLAEEWAMHDYDDMHSFGEYPELQEIADYVDLCEQYDQESVDVLMEYHSSNLEYVKDDFQNGMASVHRSWEDYVADYVDNCILCDIDNSIVKSYFDYEAFGRDMESEGVKQHDLPSGEILVVCSY